MGVRSGGLPSAEQSFVMRLLHGLNLTYNDLAHEIAHDNPALFREVVETLKEWADAAPNKLPDVDRDAVWFAILQYIDRQYAYLMAAKHEVNTLLLKQRELRAVRTTELRALGTIPSPSSLPRRQR